MYLGNMDGALEYPTVELEDMVSITGTVYKTDRLTDNYGNRYSRAIYNEDYYSEVLESFKYEV